LNILDFRFALLTARVAQSEIENQKSKMQVA